RPSVERFLDESRQRQALLEPISPIASKLPLRGVWIQEDEPARPAVVCRKAVQEAEDFGKRLGRKSRDADRANVELSDPWCKSAVEVLTREDEIQVRRNRRYANGMVESRDASMKMRQELRRIHPPQVQDGRQRVLDLIETSTKVVEHVLPS